MKNFGFKAALFDLDGVVFDTEPQYTCFWGAQCREFRPDHPGLEHDIKGQTLVEILDNHFAGELKNKQPLIVERLKQFEKDMNFVFVRGFENFVSQLRRNGIKTAVVTSSNLEKMQTVYNKCQQFQSLFDAILTSEDFERSKPDPDCYLKAAQRFEAQAEECIVFEDSFNGLKSGKSAGMRVVGLSTTNTPESIEPFSDIVISDYSSFGIEDCMKLIASNYSNNNQ
ncbi:MAG: HAD family hydrolase [Prevotella sp.]